MNETSEQITASSSTAPPAAFKSFKSAYKVLRTLQPPILDEAKTVFLNQIRGSRSARYIAFHLLALRTFGELQAKLGPFLSELEAILYRDETPLDLRTCDSLDAVQTSVNERFSKLGGKEEWKSFLEAGSHLPLIYGLIRTWDDATRFQAGLNALASAIDRPIKGHRAAAYSAPNNLEVVARSLLAWVPEKPGLGKALPKLLKVVWALFRQAEETNRENLRLKSALATANAEIASLDSSLQSELTARQEQERVVEQLQKRVAGLEANLAEEKEHFETLKAHGVEERRRAVEDAVARVRSEVLRRVENIRLFADREQPNRSGIVNLVEEIMEALRSDGETR